MHGSRTTVIAVLALTLFTAVAHGVATSRWSGGRDGTVSIPAVPMTMGDWVGSEDEVDRDDPGLVHQTRRYTHSRSGRSFVISLTVGHPGLTAVHTPEYCYRGSGYDQVGPVERRAAEVRGGPPAAFWTTQFEKKSATGTERLRLFWSWSAGSGWAAPDSPRWHYLGKASLYKLYVVEGGQADVAPGKDPALDEFFSTLLTRLDQSLFALPGGSAAP
jgi:hypothetical protein